MTQTFLFKKTLKYSYKVSVSDIDFKNYGIYTRICVTASRIHLSSDARRAKIFSMMGVDTITEW